ncbi:MAG: ATP-binding protein, partial [Spirochaetota bacterium]|nr:ATP-binding protein [Spirochaetota bacterium]
LIGVIQVLNKKEGEFQKIDEHIIEILSSYIAAALRDTLAIKNLQQRGIDPDLLDGISSVNKHIFNEYLIIHETIKEIEPPAIDTIKTRMKDVLQLLEKINFLFDDHYIEHKEEIKAKDILESFRSFIIENKGDKHIIYNDKINISSQLKLFADLDLINKAVLEILINSIESIIEEGEIKIWMHNHVIIPNNIAQDYLIDEIISEYNTLSEENHAGFMNFVTSRKPLLQDDLNKIIGSMKEFIAIEIFDSGLEIKNDIKDKIFHPFFSTKNRFGLGLAVTKSALNKMGGMIEGPIVSKEGKSIRVLIPLQN